MIVRSSWLAGCRLNLVSCRHRDWRCLANLWQIWQLDFGGRHVFHQKKMVKTLALQSEGKSGFYMILKDLRNKQKGSLCAFCREVVPTKPFTNTALYYKMMLESEPTPLATKWFGGFYDGSKANLGHCKMTLRNHFVVKTGCNEESWFATKWFHFGWLSGPRS